MNELIGMKLIYESLVPIINPDDTFLSVGTVTFLQNEELNLDFNETTTTISPLPDSKIKLESNLRDFEPRTFLEEYRRQGLKISDLNFAFFLKHFSEIYLSEVYTEYCSRNGEELFYPLTLTNAYLLFQDGSILDYSSHITVFALNELAEVA